MADVGSLFFAKDQASGFQADVTIPLFDFRGNIEPDLEDIYDFSDQDGAIGTEYYLVDVFPIIEEATIVGVPDEGEPVTVKGTFTLLQENRTRKGTLSITRRRKGKNPNSAMATKTFTDIRLLNVFYMEPVSQGTTYERMKITFVKEKRQ